MAKLHLKLIYGHNLLDMDSTNSELMLNHIDKQISRYNPSEEADMEIKKNILPFRSNMLNFVCDPIS